MENPYESPNTIAQEEIYTESSERTIPETPINLDPAWCISRGWKLTCQNFKLFFLCISLPLIIVWLVNFVLSQIAVSIDGKTILRIGNEIIEYNNFGFVTLVTMVISNVFGILLFMGIIKVTLDYLDGKPISLSTAFSQTSKIVTAILASLLFYTAYAIGLVLFIVPGIYIASKYGYYLHAIVDKNCGIMESFKYSEKLTANNKMNFFVLGIYALLVGIAGALALLVGLLWAYPTIYLAVSIGYCCLHHGKSNKLEQI